MSTYHMRRQDRQITDEGSINEMLMNGKFAVIAMCNENEPYIVSLSYGYDKQQGTLYFHTGYDGHKMDFLKKNPNVCATIIQDGGYIQNECGHHYCTVVIRGKMNIVESQEEKKRGIETLIRHLEENPDKMLKKLEDSNPLFEKTAILRLKIENLTCKKGR
jgi:nitroimidazol reductase NimA-like FMN-containing flavoprotein (pyridoxamine 5'-phosphate oxidase superfamily)